MCKLKVRDVGGPVGWVCGAVEAEIGLNFLVKMFSLAIGLGVMHCGELGLDMQFPTQSLEDFGCKLGAPVGDDYFR